MTKWNVWSVDTSLKRALVVDEGARLYALDSAARRNSSAERLNVKNLRFVALPEGQVPSE